MGNRIDLVAGQNCPLSTLSLHVLVSHGTSPQGMELDVSAFLLNAVGKVSKDEDFIFFNQPARVDQGVLLEPEQSRFTLHLDRPSSDVQKIALTMTIADGTSKGQNFSHLKNVTVLVKDFLTGMEIACFALDTTPNKETALILAEFYRHQDKWKFRAVGQGFIGGLQPLAEYYGVNVSEAEDSVANTTPLPPAAKINLTKVTLEKKGQSISLDKHADGLSEIMVNLNWNATPVKSLGFFRKVAAEGIDLDLACLWEFEQGEIGATQALGGHFGNFHQFPFIELDQDDRSGQSVGGETLRINGRYWQEFRRILIYTFIYEGVPNWSHVDAVITIKAKDQPDIEIRLDSYRDDQFLCAIAMLENINNQVKITKLIDYFSGHQEMDRAYGWGLNYVAGSK
ncbi:MAG: TerD domain-containing protein [Methylococcaceae bacterium]|nr:TerD domain-containing protein [Methylococcaceae bacterium]MDD1608389.1 TerD domain-containing protein [Methylococcaceae bacterium]